MATLQVPPRLSAQTSHMYDDFDSSPSLASPSKRLAMESPCMNFDRPFAGPRLELPTLYQLAPNRSALDEDPSTSRPGTPPPQEQRRSKAGLCNYADNLSGLGLKACDSLTGSLASLRSTVGDISQEDIAETLQEYNSSNELSVSPGLVTPLTSTPSSENVRKNKTKSMHVTATSAGLAFISNLPLDPPSLGRTAILERRKHTHTKAFSVSSLSSGHGHPDEGTRIHSRKRHAIYGDSEWQVDLPASDSHSSSVGPRRPLDVVLVLAIA
ncbi:hypothetical protein BC629DRAFT_1541036 [Irpex lacteus]|nr:hypothetical protein BC629DRAFT_1541036 [Irpex lacteus]